MRKLIGCLMVSILLGRTNRGEFASKRSARRSYHPSKTQQTQANQQTHCMC
jgi:hypothetical protein